MLPVYVLTGFLGSGKTTLLNGLLARRATLRRTGKIALVVNELGEVGVDGALLPVDATRQIELPGGCVCCVLGPELDQSLHELLDAQPDLQAVVLETTGVAEPLPITWALEGDALASRFRLGAVVTVVDATSLASARGLSPAVDAQLRNADVVVLSKLDLATPEERLATLAVLDELAPRAPRLSDGIAAAAAWLDDVLEEPSLAPVPHAPQLMAAPGGQQHAVGPTHGISSVAIEIDFPIDLEELLDNLADLPSNYVRIKGVAQVRDGRAGRTDLHWAVFHRVGLRVSSEPIAAPKLTHGRAVGLGLEVTREPLRHAVLAAKLDL